jgi:hypothetical protein
VRCRKLEMSCFADSICEYCLESVTLWTLGL